MMHPSIIQGCRSRQTRPKRGEGDNFRIGQLLRCRTQRVRTGKQHALHVYEGKDKIYYVLEGRGRFLLEGRELEMKAGDLLV